MQHSKPVYYFFVARYKLRVMVSFPVFVSNGPKKIFKDFLKNFRPVVTKIELLTRDLYKGYKYKKERVHLF